MDDEELQTLKDRAAYFGLDKTKNFDDFQKKYLKAAEEVTHSEGVKVAADTVKFVPAKDIAEAEAYIKQYVDATQFGALGVSYSGITVDAANAINEALNKIYSKYNLVLCQDLVQVKMRNFSSS